MHELLRNFDEHILAVLLAFKLALMSTLTKKPEQILWRKSGVAGASATAALPALTCFCTLYTDTSKALAVYLAGAVPWIVDIFSFYFRTKLAHASVAYRGLEMEVLLHFFITLPKPTAFFKFFLDKECGAHDCEPDRELRSSSLI